MKLYKCLLLHQAAIIISGTFLTGILQMLKIVVSQRQVSACLPEICTVCHMPLQ